MKKNFHWRPVIASLFCILGFAFTATVKGQCNANQAYTAASPLGIQSWAGPLGMDFDVNSPVRIDQLGAYDHNNDGFEGSGIQVAIFDRNAPNNMVAGPVTITSADILVGGHRMQNISPVLLGPGQYSIVAVGFNISDLNGNSGYTGYPPTLTNNGGGAISFVGSGRYDNPSTLSYPTLTDGGPHNRYHAGTFTFTAVAEEVCNGIDDNCDGDIDEGFANFDNDTEADCVDADDDNDGSPDNVDTDDGNNLICQDTDADGCDDCSSGSFNPGNDGTDTDGDGKCNSTDLDDDNDGIPDGTDKCPTGITGTGNDLDGDGCKDAEDLDDDGDGRDDTYDCDPRSKKNDKVLVCHKGKETICVDWNGWINGHKKHGDQLGPCPTQPITSAKADNSDLARKDKSICKKNETRMCKDNVSECVKKNDVQDRLANGWVIGDCDIAEARQATGDAAIKQTPKAALPSDYKISNFPNPFSALTTIKYDVPVDSRVSLKVYNLSGQAIATLVDGDKKAGSHSVQFNASNLAKGTYYAKMVATSADQQSVKSQQLSVVK